MIGKTLTLNGKEATVTGWSAVGDTLLIVWVKCGDHEIALRGPDLLAAFGTNRVDNISRLLQGGKP